MRGKPTHGFTEFCDAVIAARGVDQYFSRREREHSDREVTARNPKTGERLRLDRANHHWVPKEAMRGSVADSSYGFLLGSGGFLTPPMMPIPVHSSVSSCSGLKPSETSFSRGVRLSSCGVSSLGMIFIFSQRMHASSG